jgi:hypothetical protein
MRPLAIDLFCGLGGWTEGLLAEGYYVVGFDLERHVYGEHRYPAQLVLQDVLTIHGRQFKDAALIVASPPCQEYSYMAMPWSKAKQKIREYEDGTRDVKQLTALFDACFRIQREACEAAGRHIPMVVENVRGAQKWVGRSRWNFGSFHLWGDVPALMPMARSIKNAGGSWFNIGSPGQKVTNKNPVHELAGHKRISEQWRSKRGQTVEGIASGAFAPSEDGVKLAGISGPRANGKGDAWFQDGAAKHGSKSPARKAASAMIAKIPLVLSRHIAAAWKPEYAEQVSA